MTNINALLKHFDSKINEAEVEDNLKSYKYWSELKENALSAYGVKALTEADPHTGTKTTLYEPINAPKSAIHEIEDYNLRKTLA